MKKLFLLLLIVPFYFVSCSDDDDISNKDIKLFVSNESDFISVYLQGDGIVIDWGDGETETTENLKKPTLFSHRYEKAGNYTVSISTDELVVFSVDAYTVDNIDWGHSSLLDSLSISHLDVKSFDTRKYPNLRFLSIFNSPELTSLDLNAAARLKTLVVTETSITNLDLSKNAKLTYLQCNKNKLQSLDLKGNLDLTYVYCKENEISSIDISKNQKLGWLICDNNKLESLDLSNNPLIGVINVTYCNFSTDALNSMFTSLPKDGNARGVYVANNPGSLTCDPSIASAKGWIVNK